jgi:hypothetical protein
VRRWQIALLLAVACTLSAAAGFWAGFREGWNVGAAADLLPRAARSVVHLEALHAGNTRPVLLGLEFDVDSGLIWGDQVMSHPLRELWSPVWGIDVYPAYEKYLGQLADYRVDHPSSTRTEMFASAPENRPDLQDTLRDFNRSAREVAERRDAVVRRYATKR